MPQKVDIKRKFLARSDRVKSVDIHPTEPWILASLYNGHVYIWNYNNQGVVKTFEVTDLPVRTAKFIARKQWLIAGADDMNIRVYNYNTMEKLKTFEAHSDYIRCVAVHPTLPYVLSSSDDMLIKLWDWDKQWANTMVFEGHTHYVMMLTINPKDPNTFASASLDKTIKVWGFNSPTPHFTLEGHDKGVNCVEYYPGGEKPFLVSGADDKLVKVWDYQNRTCVQTLEGHSHNVSVVCFHPELPLILSGSEDGTIKVWHSNTYRAERTLNYGLERVWAISYVKGSNRIAVGYDLGAVMIKIGKEAPVVSMDQSGKIIWAKHNEIQIANIKTIEGTEIQDGEVLPLAVKELGSCEMYPQTLAHNSNGRFVAVSGDGEYTIYTALAWRNKSFGSALDVVWASESGEYAVRESTSKVVIFNKNFKEQKSFRPPFSAEGIFGGNLLGIRSSSFVCFYDWAECRVVRRIDVVPRSILWSESGEQVAIATESSYYILKYSNELVQKTLDGGVELPEEGIEEAFDLLYEINEKVRTAVWAGDCFIYNTNTNKLNYCVGGNVVTISHLDRPMYILGYIPRESRIYLIDRNLNVVTYSLHLSIVNYQTAILRQDLAAAEQILPSIPKDQRNRVAHFLDNQGLKEMALEVSNDPEHKFELAVALGKLEVAREIAKEAESDHKWKALGDLALTRGELGLGEECLLKANDLAGLLLLYTSNSDAAALARLAELARQKDKNNIAFVCSLLLQRTEDCIDLLSTTNRIPEAAFLARTYMPSHVSRLVQLWREDLKKINVKAAESLADPMEYENLFPDIDWALKAEELFVKQRTRPVPASSFLDVKETFNRDVIEEMKNIALERESHTEEPTSEEQPVDAPTSEEQPVDAPTSEEQPADAPTEPGEEVPS